MNLNRIGTAMAAIAGLAHSQSTTAGRPGFEVASIKLNPDCNNRPKSVPSPSPGRLTLECITLQAAIQSAYSIYADGLSANPKLIQISGGPSWSNSDYYDIVANAEGNAPQTQMRGPMLQTLLEERFKLWLHPETRQVPIYALTVAKNGPKLERSKAGSCISLDVNHVPPPVPGQPLPDICGRPIPGMKGRNVTMDARGMSMKDLAEGLLSRILDRPVIDRTGLAETFDFHLEFTPDETTPLGASAPQAPGDPGRSPLAADPAGLSIFTAVEEQMGLKLVPDRGPIQVLVIDRAERPAGN
jgi:uncharacterized protein (TIGR03435 family)